MSDGSGPRLNRVLVTGVGVASPLGCSVPRFWNQLLEGKSGVRRISDIALLHCRTQIGAQVSEYDDRQYFSQKELQRLSKTSQFAIVATTEAIHDAQLKIKSFESSKVAIIIGSSIGGFVASEPFFQDIFTTGTASPLTIPVVMNNAPASNISIRFGIKGPMLTTDAACASSAHAIGYAFNMIRFGLVDAVITGGADSALSPGVIQAWSGLRALSERNDSPEQASRPFSRDRDGIVLGEGSGILILESEESATKRNAKIYAEIIGYGATSDGHHLTQPSSRGNGEAMRLALTDARLPPESIDYINAHATATTWNDKTETTAIKNVFGSHAYKIPIVGIKAAIGHSIGAVASLEFISCMLSIRDGIVPPTINYTERDPECDLDYVVEGKRACEVNHVMSNSFAFGGSNAVLIATRYAAH